MNGEVDDLMLNIPSNEIAGLKANSDYTVYERASNNRTYLTFNFDEEPFNDVRVREAVNLGINRQEVLDKAAKGIGAVPKYYMTPVFAWADERRGDDSRNAMWKKHVSCWKKPGIRPTLTACI